MFAWIMDFGRNGKAFHSDCPTAKQAYHEGMQAFRASIRNGGVSGYFEFRLWSHDAFGRMIKLHAKHGVSSGWSDHR